MIRKWLLKFIYPFTVFLGKFSLKRKIGDEFYAETLRAIEPGDIILSRRKWELSNLFIPGKYTHAAMFFKDANGLPMIIESIGKGVVKKSLAKFLFAKDYIVILRASEMSGFERHLASVEAQRHLGKPYDYFFDKSIDAFYCSELIHYCLSKTSKLYAFKPGLTLGMETVTPEDFYNNEKHFYKLLES